MIDGKTQIYGILGEGVRESLSPVIHNRSFARMGINAVYLAFETHDLEQAVTGLRGLGVRGASVTVPFKSRIIPLLDDLDPFAERIKAVNTIRNEGKKLVGYNTDWLGALHALEQQVSLKGRKVLVLGAGGAARAVAFGLKERNCAVAIFNRSPEKGRSLAEEFRFEFIPTLTGNRKGFEVIINTTSAGMHPNITDCPVPPQLFRAGMTVMEIVYRPVKTMFLQHAEQRGCRIIPGLEMLAGQGAAQFQLWTGRNPDLNRIREDLYSAANHTAPTIQASNQHSLRGEHRND